MSDARLRELERRWKATGSVEDETALLMERARSGELAPGRLELAAFCGHRAALRAHGPAPGPMRGSLWLDLVVGWGQEVAVLGAALALESALRVWEAAKPDDDRPRRAIALARDCLASADRSPEMVERADEASFLADEAFDEAKASGLARPAKAALAAMALARVVYWLKMPSVDNGLSAKDWSFALRCASEATGVHEESVRENVREQLALWALYGEREKTDRRE